MADTHDTIDGLLAEFRGYSAGMPPSYHVTMSWADFRKMLDRFDAAHRRDSAKIEADAPAVGGIVAATAAKSSAVGGAAKLREALKRIVAASIVAKNANAPEWILQRMADVFAMATTALSVPPRNCDMYANYNDAMKAFEEFVRGQGKLGFINPYTEAFKWLFATATEKEGGNDAD